MVEYEIINKLYQLEGDMIELETRIDNASESIKQLECLKACCVDYQNEFCDCKYDRSQKVEELLNIIGQDTLIRGYTNMIDELLVGKEYLSAYSEADMALADIEHEISRQRLIISECTVEKSKLSGKITYWERELTNMQGN